MDGADVNGLVAVIAEADFAACDRMGLSDIVDALHRVRSWIDAMEARVVQAATRLAASGECEPPAALLAVSGRRAYREAETAARRSGACELLPQLHDALAEGSVSAGHADAVARVLGDLDDQGRAELRQLEPSLVRSAQTRTVEQYERELRDLGRVLSRDEGVGRQERLRRQRTLKRWVDRQTGLCHTHLILDPVADAAVSAAYDRALATEKTAAQSEDRSIDQVRADAMVGLITGEHRAGKGGAEVLVLIDLDTLHHGMHDRTVCETADAQPIPPETVRRMACDAALIPVMLDTTGITVDVGRDARVATKAQRQALRAMYPSCGHPGCTVRFDACEIHHVIEWAHGGPTDLANLLPLCSRHHHLVHEGGWALTLHPDRTITLTRPDGTLHYSGTTLERSPPTPNPRPRTTRTPRARRRHPHRHRPRQGAGASRPLARGLMTRSAGGSWPGGCPRGRPSGQLRIRAQAERVATSRRPTPGGGCRGRSGRRAR